MRWNCPHCNTALAVSDDKLGPTWSFSRCYHCGGFALVRKNEPQETIKVAQPAVSENSPPLMNKAATEHLSAVRDGKTRAATPGPPRFVPPAAALKNTGKAWEAALKAQLEEISASLPEPLPEVPQHPWYRRYVPFAMLALAAVSIGSGTAAFFEGRALWNKARAEADRDRGEHLAVLNAPLAPGNPNVPNDPKEPVIVQSAPTRDPVLPTAPAVATAEPTPERQSNLRVRPKSANIKLRSGPGTQYRILATANPKEDLRVFEWRGDWFRVKRIEDSGESAITAWIRNDLVEVLRDP